MSDIKAREIKRIARHARLRKKLVGTPDQLRLCVHRSINNLSAQIVDDTHGKVVYGLSTLNKDMRKKIKSGGNVGAASVLGQAFAEELVKKGIKKVSFDRGGYQYHGRIKAFAEAARKGGLEF